MRNINEDKVLRVIDANLNRAKEALRVCEDVTRFFFDNKKLTRNYKVLRHDLTDATTSLSENHRKMIAARNILNDVGVSSTKSELKRRNIKDIFFANTQRAKESVRVLEEFTKLLSPKAAQGFKKARYKIYELEREIVTKF